MAVGDVIQKDLGLVTAYGYALAGGYEGTEEQFIEDFAALISGQYNALKNHPSINGVELVGDKTSEELGISGSGATDTTWVRASNGQVMGLRFEKGSYQKYTLQDGSYEISRTIDGESKAIGYISSEGTIYDGEDDATLGVSLTANTKSSYINFGYGGAQKLVFVSPYASDGFVNVNKYTKNAFNMTSDLNMMGHNILNCPSISGGSSASVETNVDVSSAFNVNSTLWSGASVNTARMSRWGRITQIFCYVTIPAKSYAGGLSTLLTVNSNSSHANKLKPLSETYCSESVAGFTTSAFDINETPTADLLGSSYEVFLPRGEFSSSGSIAIAGTFINQYEE